MSIGFVNQVRKAVAQLNPSEIRESSARPVKILRCRRLQRARLPRWKITLRRRRCRGGSGPRRWPHSRAPGDPARPGSIDLLLLEDGMAVPPRLEASVTISSCSTMHGPREWSGRSWSGGTNSRWPWRACSSLFDGPWSRRPFTRSSKENALFSLMTAIPNVLPNAFELPWAVGEFASDTAVLTANQIRMAFFLAGASDREVGFKEQRSQIGSIIAGAWGWRAIARELIGKIPFGGGLIPKAAIAYAGTYVVGLSLERVYRIGYGLSREEREGAYAAAFEKGKEVAGALLESLRKGR